PDAAPRPARARHQSIDVAVLLRAAGDPRSPRLSPRAVDRGGHAQAALGLSRRHPPAGPPDPRTRSTPPRPQRGAEDRPGLMAVARPALLEGSRPSGVYTRHDIHGDTVIDSDVVVIGSGAGGATIAAELAEAGFDVVVVEEGSYYQTRDFTADSSA